jgi:hypothetical protein
MELLSKYQAMRKRTNMIAAAQQNTCMGSVLMSPERSVDSRKIIPLINEMPPAKASNCRELEIF